MNEFSSAPERHPASKKNYPPNPANRRDGTIIISPENNSQALSIKAKTRI
jgi:hypothetical protein